MCASAIAICSGPRAMPQTVSMDLAAHLPQWESTGVTGLTMPWWVGLITHESTLTDANGNYFFSFLTPNTYTVSEVLRPNWQQTCPAAPGTHVVVLNQGQTVTGMDFGNKALANVQDL